MLVICFLGVKQHGSLSCCGTAKQLEGSCRFVQARQKKNVSLKSFQARQQSSVLSGSWILLKTMYSLWESRLVVGGRVGRLGEGFQARAHAARALKVLLVTRWRYVTVRVKLVWAINCTHVTQTTVLFLPLWFLVLGSKCDTS